MAAPFYPHEQEKIRAALLDAAMRHACTTGMKHTTVDQLTEEVGISKGAFYHFYASKEMLFLSMLENWYKDIVQQAVDVYTEHAALNPVERAGLAFRTTFSLMMGRPLVRFIREELPVLLRRLPQDILSAHSTDVDDFIISLLHRTQIPLLIEQPVAVAIIKTMIMSIIHAEEIGTYYEKAIEVMVLSLCAQFVRS